MKAGDKIRVDWEAHGYFEDTKDYVVEEFRHTLGIFESEQHREAGNFTPLCTIYYDGPNTEKKYISNYGEYKTNLVQGWIDLP